MTVGIQDVARRRRSGGYFFFYSLHRALLSGGNSYKEPLEEVQLANSRQFEVC